MTVSIRFMYKSYTQCQKVRKGSLTEKRKRDRSMSKGHRSELKVLKGRAVPSPPFICSFNHLCISVCPHGYLFYSSGYNSVVCSVAKSCPTLYDPKHYSRLGSSVHGIFQARILE